ncbi:MAG TPA: transcriptional repressor [Chloroflexota bacterium]
MTPAADEILGHLHRLGHNRSDRRRAVVEAVCARSGSFAAQEIADELAPRQIGRATVYRTIAVMQELGYLSRLHVGEECHRYALCDATHHHLVCTSCGQVFPFDECEVEQTAARAAARVGFAVAGHHVDIYGRCATCQTASSR